jgi:hypothetical protein
MSPINDTIKRISELILAYWPPTLQAFLRKFDRDHMREREREREREKNVGFGMFSGFIQQRNNDIF